VAAAQLVGEILEHGEVGSADELAGLLEELDQWVHDKQANLLEAPEDVKRDWAALSCPGTRAASGRPAMMLITLDPVGRVAVELVPGSLVL
jgi:hypothetical protein